MLTFDYEKETNLGVGKIYKKREKARGRKGERKKLEGEKEEGNC